MKKINNFENFLNEISQDYLQKQLNKAKNTEDRPISTQYSDMLKSKLYKQTNKINEENVNNFIKNLENYLKSKNIEYNIIRPNRVGDNSVELAHYVEIKVILPSGAMKISYFYDIDTLYCNIGTNDETKVSCSRIDEAIPLNILTRLFKENIPNSKYTNRKIWSSL